LALFLDLPFDVEELIQVLLDRYARERLTRGHLGDLAGLIVIAPGRGISPDVRRGEAVEQRVVGGMDRD
jgi:hypothetical protein